MNIARRVWLLIFGPSCPVQPCTTCGQPFWTWSHRGVAFREFDCARCRQRREDQAAAEIVAEALASDDEAPE